MEMDGGMTMKQKNSGDKGMDPVATLTPREKHIFYMLLEGMKAREIALKESISISGVQYFTKRIYKKLGVNSKIQLVLKYYNLRQPTV